MINKLTKTQQEKLGKVCFLGLGITSLIGWNAILTSLDYFQSCFLNYNVYFLLGIPYYIGTNIFGVLIIYIAKKFPIKTRIYIPFAIMAIIMILQPIQAYLMKSNAGFWLQMVMVFIFSCFNSIGQCTSIGFAAIFTQYPYIPIFFAGSGLAGVIVCVVRAILLGSLSTEATDLGAIIYYIIAAVLIFISLIVNHIFFKTPLCIYQLKQAKIMSYHGSSSFFASILQSEKEKENDQLDKKKVKNINNQQVAINKAEDTIDNNKEAKLLNNDDKLAVGQAQGHKTQSKQNTDLEYYNKADLDLKVGSNDEENIQEENKLKKLWRLINKTMPMPLVVWLTYIQTFLLFPGVNIEKFTYYYVSDSWKLVILILVFNIFDTCGKQITALKFYGIKMCTLVCFCRFGFFVIYILGAVTVNWAVIDAMWFSLIAMALFGFTNGASMSLAPQMVTKKEMEIVGFFMTFLLLNGIMCGGIIAYFTFEKLSK